MIKIYLVIVILLKLELCILYQILCEVPKIQNDCTISYFFDFLKNIIYESKITF